MVVENQASTFEADLTLLMASFAMIRNGDLMESLQQQTSRLFIQEGGMIQCLTCERRCKLKRSGDLGWCRTRQRQGDSLILINYGAVSSLASNPIEKKPFYHFYPGTKAYTIGGWSCNFGCPWCQNFTISKTDPPHDGEYLSPEEFIQRTIESGCQGTSVSFNEPTLSYEWCLDMFPIARKRGLYNTFVTNGYMTSEALDQLAAAGLDALNIDVKGDNEAVRRYCRGVDQEKVWARCRQTLYLELHLEITTLVVTGVNDTRLCLEKIAKRIVEELGEEIPWHVSAYHPAYRYDAPATSMDTLMMAYEVGRKAGLHFVYAGKIPDRIGSRTICPECGEDLIQREGFNVTYTNLKEGCCPKCGAAIYGIGLDPGFS